MTHGKTNSYGETMARQEKSQKNAHSTVSKTASYNENSPLYNSRIIKISIDCLNDLFPQVNVSDILEKAGISSEEVEDPAHWFNQQQVDFFNREAVAQTSAPDFSRLSGRHYAQTRSLGPLKQYAIGLMSMAMVFKALKRLHPTISRGAVLQTRPLSRTQIEVIATPAPGVNEKPYQCQNRIGVLEAIGKIFHNEYNAVTHPECYHHDHNACRYIVSWKLTPQSKWRRTRNMGILAGASLACIAYPLLPIKYWSWLVLTAGGMILYLFFQTERHKARALADIVTQQAQAAERRMIKDKQLYDSAVLFQELGQAISEVHEPRGLINNIARVMAKRLRFDRGAFLLADPTRQHLVYQGGYGFSKKQTKLIASRQVPINDASREDLIGKVFRLQKPILVPRATEFKNHFSDKGFKIAEKLGGTSLISVPIVYEKESIGVLIVDSVQQTYPLMQRDVGFLMGIAAQIALGITNARAFQKISQSEAKYRLMAANVTDVIWILELTELKFIYISPAVKKLLGFTPEEAINRAISESLAPESLARIMNALAEELALDHTDGVDTDRSRTLEVEQNRKDGSTVWTEVTARFLRDANGNATHAIGISRDISQRQRDEKKRRQLEARLQRAEKMEALGTMAGGVAHDLNNILAGITGYPEMLLLDLPQDNPMRQTIETIHRSGLKAAAVVQDMLTLARRSVTSTDMVDLNEIVSEYLQSPEHGDLAAVHTRVRFKSYLDPQLLKITGSALHLTKAVMNLVYNAAEAIKGVGEVVITTKNRYIDTVKIGYDTIDDGDYAVLTVSDNGSGILPEDIDYIFEPFYSKKKMGRSGTGLGMAVVWGTVKDHEGYIDVQSEKDHGTVLTLYFPITREPEMNEIPAQQKKDLSGDGQTISSWMMWMINAKLPRPCCPTLATRSIRCPVVKQR